MIKTAVIYKSRYGTTKRYAQWLADALNADIFDAADISTLQLNNYDILIYGGSLYAGSIAGLKSVSKNIGENFNKTLVVFTVGLADPSITDYSPILQKAFTSKQLEKTKIFHLRGGINYKKLSFLHKIMMSFKKREAEKLPPDQRTSDDIGVLETYGKEVDFTSKAAIEPLLEFVRALYT